MTGCPDSCAGAAVCGKLKKGKTAMQEYEEIAAELEMKKQEIDRFRTDLDRWGGPIPEDDAKQLAAAVVTMVKGFGELLIKAKALEHKITEDMLAARRARHE